MIILQEDETDAFVDNDEARFEEEVRTEEEESTSQELV